MQEKIIGIPANNLSLGANLFISIYKTLNSNGYKCYFINPNNIVKYKLNNLNIRYIELSKKEKKNIKYIKKYKNINNIFYQEHKKILQVYFGKYKNIILKEYLRDYSESKYLIEKYKINTLLIHNGYYQITKLLSKDLGIETIYFENGYFGNDLQIDNKGINANSSISLINYNSFKKIKKITGKIKKLKIEKTKNSINYFLYLYLGFISVSLKSSYIFFVYIFKKSFFNFKRKIITYFLKETIINKGKYIIIGFQVYDDTQIVFNSTIIKKMNDILDYFYEDIKKILPNHKIIVKEHPMDIGRIDYSSIQKKYPNIIWIKKGNIGNYIEKSEYLICINSSIGLQALSKYKKVLTLGKNFYSNNPWVKNIENIKDFKDKLLQLKNQNILKDKKEIDKYINIFKKEIFINGSWYNFTKNTIKEICEYIIK